MNSEVLVSTQLFPLELLVQVADRLAPGARCNMVPAGNQVVRVELTDPGEGAPADSAVLRFKRELTAAVIGFWQQQGQSGFSGPCGCLEPHTVTIAFPGNGIAYQVRQGPERIQVLLSLDCTLVKWPRLLEILCGLTGVAVMVDSLWPVDRYVVLLEMSADARPDQVAQQLLAELLAQRKTAGPSRAG